MRVIVTRPQQEVGKWVDSLASAGFDAVALPLIEVSAAPNTQAVVSAWEQLHTYDAVMFVSGNAVEHFFALKPTQAPVFTVQAAIKTRAFVTGPGSYSALQRVHAEAAFIDAPDEQAGQFDSEALWAVAGHRVQPGYRVLIVRGAGSLVTSGDKGHGRDWFADHVQAAGGVVDYVVAYQRRCPALTEENMALVRQAAADGSVWLFSSSEAILNLVSCGAKQSWQQARAVVTHARIAQVARDVGFAVVCESRPKLASLVASIESLQ
ncbi:MAG: uroporphyrinogen-III synthase [Rhodoferax sp.]|nr:uroporphyrinogen-III synthase [Rhodoferax sp.]MDP3650636.1 uroporphyrinogen-III synthase [Rhodoferax sp.]